MRGLSRSPERFVRSLRAIGCKRELERPAHFDRGAFRDRAIADNTAALEALREAGIWIKNPSSIETEITKLLEIARRMHGAGLVPAIVVRPPIGASDVDSALVSLGLGGAEHFPKIHVGNSQGELSEVDTSHATGWHSVVIDASSTPHVRYRQADGMLPAAGRLTARIRARWLAERIGRQPVARSQDPLQVFSPKASQYHYLQLMRRIQGRAPLDPNGQLAALSGYYVEGVTGQAQQLYGCAITTENGITSFSAPSQPYDTLRFRLTLAA